MSYASANSSKKATKALELGELNPIAVKIDNNVKVIPTGNKSYVFSVEKGFSEITAYTNGLDKGKNGETKRINKKSGKAYKTRSVSARIEGNRNTKSTVVESVRE